MSKITITATRENSRDYYVVRHQHKHGTGSVAVIDYTIPVLGQPRIKKLTAYGFAPTEVQIEIDRNVERFVAVENIRRRLIK